MRWVWPFGGASDVRASAPSAAPDVVIEAARGTGLPSVFPSLLFLTIAAGDDPSHALLLARRNPRSELAVFELEADQSPVEIRRADGEPFGEIDGAVRASGRWYVVTPSTQGARVENLVWQVDGATARARARPACSSSGWTRESPGRLATRADGRALGLVVDGQPLGDRAGATRWVASIDLDTGAVGDIDLLGPFDLGGRARGHSLRQRRSRVVAGRSARREQRVPDRDLRAAAVSRSARSAVRSDGSASPHPRSPMPASSASRGPSGPRSSGARPTPALPLLPRPLR